MGDSPVRQLSSLPFDPSVTKRPGPQSLTSHTRFH